MGDDFKIEPVGGVLDGVLFGSVMPADSQQSLAIGKKAGLVAAVRHWVQRRFHKGAFGLLGNRRAPSNARRVSGRPAHRLTLVIEPVSSVTRQDKGIMHLVAVPSAIAAHFVGIIIAQPFARLTRSQHRRFGAVPRPVRRFRPGHANRIPRPMGIGIIDSLIIKVKPTAGHQRIGSKDRTSVIGVFGAAADGWPLFLPMEAVSGSGVPYFSQIPIEDRGIPALLAARRLVGRIAVLGRLTAGVPDVVSPVDSQDGSRVAAGYAGLLADAADLAVFEGGIKFAGRILKAAPFIIESLAGGAQGEVDGLGRRRFAGQKWLVACDGFHGISFRSGSYQRLFRQSSCRAHWYWR